MKNLLVTGGYGFIGSNFIRYVFEKTDFDGRVINYDKLTYAANQLNLKDIEKKFSSRYIFVKSDICNYDALVSVIKNYDIDTIIHFAAQTHVDRSITFPDEFIRTNITGTFEILKAILSFKKRIRIHHISTDEVYGSLGESGYFYETTPYNPRSPYSASKASSDHLVRAFYHTYGIEMTISNCSNNFGPYQFPEKLIPLTILNAINGINLPVYGDGKNIRDWLYVEDHCCAVWMILEKGIIGQTYNIGGDCEKRNIDLVREICERLEGIFPSKDNKNLNGRRYADLITFVKDRPGHDRRYAINCDKIKNELGWRKSYSFEEALDKTIRWYVENKDWLESIKNKEKEML